MQQTKTSKGAGMGASKRKKVALGKGLGALLPDLKPGESPNSDYFLCDVELIRPNRYQPRKHFAEEELVDLTNSVKEQGVLQPLLVRKGKTGYELIAGERRLRAAKRAGLAQVPVVLKEVSDDKLLELSIIENIQRENLNPIEEADAYHQLISRFHLTQDKAADRVGKSRSAIANFLRLRQLPDQIKISISKGDLSMGHARALLGTETETQQLAAWRTVISKALSVRETENLVRRLKNEKKKPQASPKTSEQIYFTGLSEDLSRHFGTKVNIRKSGKRGKVEIEFYSNDDLDRLLNRLRQENS